MKGLSKIALIIGEEGPLRSETARFLAAFGLDSVMVDDADQAESCLDGVDPDLVLVTSDADCEQPFARLPAAVRRYGGAGAAVMVCSKAADVRLLSLAVASGADECLVAPFDADILKFKLEQTGVLASQ